MSVFGQRIWKAVSGYFDAFDERVGGTPMRLTDEERHGGAQSGFCFAALVVAMGYMISAASASAASPF
jgi:hypothetical protein